LKYSARKSAIETPIFTRFSWQKMYVREIHSETLPLAAWNSVFKDFEGSFKVLVWSLCFTAGLSLADTMTRISEMMHT
jgi:hypothetical protein